MKTNFHIKNFALSLAFIMRFKATRKWPIEGLVQKLCLWKFDYHVPSIFLYLCFDRKPQILRISVELFVASNNLIVLNYEKVVGYFFEFKSQDKKKKLTWNYVFICKCYLVQTTFLALKVKAAAGFVNKCRCLELPNVCQV